MMTIDQIILHFSLKHKITVIMKKKFLEIWNLKEISHLHLSLQDNGVANIEDRLIRSL